MRTPYGFDCPYFYGNYYRGRNVEECRLLEGSPTRHKWKSSYCKTCPVPQISRANACPNMKLSGDISSGILGLGSRMKISAYCTLSEKSVSEPQIGCGLCHPLPPEFKGK